MLSYATQCEGSSSSSHHPVKCDHPCDSNVTNGTQQWRCEVPTPHTRRLIKNSYDGVRGLHSPKRDGAGHPAVAVAVQDSVRYAALCTCSLWKCLFICFGYFGAAQAWSRHVMSLTRAVNCMLRDCWTARRPSRAAAMESEMGNYLTFFLGKLCNASKSRGILKSHAFVAYRGHPQVLIDTTKVPDAPQICYGKDKYKNWQCPRRS